MRKEHRWQNGLLILDGYADQPMNIASCYGFCHRSRRNLVFVPEVTGVLLPQLLTIVSRYGMYTLFSFQTPTSCCRGKYDSTRYGSTACAFDSELDDVSIVWRRQRRWHRKLWKYRRCARWPIFEDVQTRFDVSTASRHHLTYRKVPGQMREAGDDPRTVQDNDGKGAKAFWRTGLLVGPSVCLVVVLWPCGLSWCWVLVSGSRRFGRLPLLFSWSPAVVGSRGEPLGMGGAPRPVHTNVVSCSSIAGSFYLVFVRGRDECP